MKRIPDQQGFGALGLVLVIAVLAIIGFAGFKVLDMNKSVDTPATTASVSEPDKIQSRQDLSDTSKVLDGADGELESSLNDEALDADLNAML